MASTPSGVNRFYLLVGVLVLGGAGTLGYLVTRPKAVSIPANVTVLAADTAGFRGYILGADSAKLEVSEWADFQCPACQSFETLQFGVVRRQLIETGQVRWRYRDFPLDQPHHQTRLAAHSAACAEEQGRYWEQHRLIYQQQATWAGNSAAEGILRDLARQAGLDLAKYDACMRSAKYAGRIQASLAEGMKLGVNSTPTFLIGGRLYPGALSSDSIKALVRSQLAKPGA